MSFSSLKDRFSSFAAGERKTSGSGNGRGQVTGVAGQPPRFAPEGDEITKEAALKAASRQNNRWPRIANDDGNGHNALSNTNVSESEIERAIATWKKLSNDPSPEISGPAKAALSSVMQRYRRGEEIQKEQVDLTFVDNEASAYADRLKDTIEQARKIYTNEQESLDKKRRLAYKDFRTQVFGDKTDENPANDDGDTLAKTFHYGSMVLSILSWCALAYTLCKALTLPWYIAGLLMLAVGYLGKAFSDGRLKMIFNNQRLAEGETSTKQKIKSAMMTLADILLEVAGIPALLALVINSNVATSWQTILSSILGVLFVEYMYYRINSQIAKDCLRDFNESVKKIVIHKNRVRDLLRAYDQYLVKMTERGQQVVRRGVSIINNLFEEKTGLV